MVQYKKFGQNPSFASIDTEIQCRQAFWSKVDIQSVGVTMKIISRPPKSDQNFKPLQRYNIWSLARIRHLVQQTGCNQAFCQNLKCWCDLENKVKSPKSNHFFPSSQQCVCESLVKIHPLVQEIQCRQWATRAPMPTGSAPKAMMIIYCQHVNTNISKKKFS